MIPLHSLLAAKPVVVHVSTGLSSWEKAVAVGGIVAGVGAAISAFFSWLSGRRSEATGRDARDALAASLKPNLVLDIDQVYEPHGVGARVLVVGPMMQGGLSTALPASDLLLEFNLRSGKHRSVSSSLLSPNDELKLRIEDSSGAWPPPEGDRHAGCGQVSAVEISRPSSPCR